MGVLRWAVETSNHADNGMYAMFAPKSKDGAQGVAICKTIGAEDWDVTLLGYEGSFIRVATGLNGMREAAEHAEYIVQRLGLYEGNYTE